MVDEPENHTLRLLRDIREEQASSRAEAAAFRAEFTAHRAEASASRAEFTAFRAEVAAAFKEVRGDIRELQVEFATMRADQGRMLGVLEKLVDGQQNHGARLNAIEGRLAIIECQTGLVKA